MFSIWEIKKWNAWEARINRKWDKEMIMQKHNKNRNQKLVKLRKSNEQI